MKDTRLYEQILGIEPPWYVEAVNLKPKLGEVEIDVSFKDLQAYGMTVVFFCLIIILLRMQLVRLHWGVRTGCSQVIPLALKPALISTA